MPTTRRSPRTLLSAEVLLRRSGRTNYRVHIYDLSRDGCKLEFVERPSIGEHLWVKFEGLDAVEGCVCWVDGHLGGIKFERPIHEAVFEVLVSRMIAPQELDSSRPASAFRTGTPAPGALYELRAQGLRAPSPAGPKGAE